VTIDSDSPTLSLSLWRAVALLIRVGVFCVLGMDGNDDAHLHESYVCPKEALGLVPCDERVG
jgi:hypothetical protein